MNGIVKKYTDTSLIIRIIIGLVLGAVLGIVAPGLTGLAIPGNVFVGALRAVAPVLVFFLVMSSLANASGSLGKRFQNVIALYMVSTFCAAFVAVAASFLFPITITINTAAAEGTPPSGIGEVITNLLLNLVKNPVSSIAEANYVGILFWSIIFGMLLKTLGKDTTRQMISDFSDVVSAAVKGVIQFAPFGIFGLVYDSVATNGMGIFYNYGKLILVLVSCMLIVALVVNPIIVFLCLRRNPYPLVLRCIRESAVTAFFTRSSAANIPVNMNLCEKLGLDRDFYSVSIPLGATINMDGAAITITIMTLAATTTLGYTVDLPSAILLSILASLGACGTSGVAGGSLLLIPMAASLFGITNEVAMQVVAVGFIIGVIQDSMETALNSSADVVFTATAEFIERKKEGRDFNY